MNVAVAHVDGIINPDHCELKAYYKKMKFENNKKYVAGHAAPARFGPYPSRRKRIAARPAGNTEQWTVHCP
jgi:hypothetical protein